MGYYKQEDPPAPVSHEQVPDFMIDVSDIGLVGLESYTPIPSNIDVSDIGLVGL